MAGAVPQLRQVFAARFYEAEFMRHNRHHRPTTVLWIGAVKHVSVDNLESIVVHRNPFQLLRAVPRVIEHENFHVLKTGEHEALDEVQLILSQIN